ncbi:sigma-54-dependent Fis family transcriptional regulator [Methylocella silvestris]|uniref:Sigma-54-dependent Fis family transcriptional regulator n=2 Tax=Methylocella silvestris TaxID=199596 RepID=A0A2J7TC71_METSI|nr:sigma 54-interacting transcriptional regulator [Methylocella silvestris]PNG24365.1 sigma-54-dependent Fis family transcriptional regulator [Methylocella silvestris]
MLLLQHVMALAGKSLAADEVFREMLHLASELLGLNRGRIVLLDEDGLGGSIRYAYGMTKAEIARGRYALDEGVTGHVLAHGHLNIIQDIDKEPGFLSRAVTRDNLPPGPVAFIALPIQIGRETVGVLACHRIRRRARLLADDVSILRILATLAAQLLHLKRYIEEKTRALEQHNALLSRALHADATRYGIVGNSPELLRAISELERVSDATATVLLLGESGTGKELFARALHLASPRRDKPFIKVNCAAIPETLFESELFGYERGAFTGASAMRAGWFEQANEGTIFLDEIGELPLNMQAKLLRTLQEGALTRLGGKREIRVDVRLVAATNRDLAENVRRGAFRQDLYYRLNVIPIQLPSLRDRRGDIPVLALHFLNHINQTNQRNVNLSADAIARLQKHAWPGNIRELSNMIERLVLLADRPSLRAVDLEPYFSGGGSPSAPTEPSLHPETLAIRPYVAAASHTAQQLRQAIVQCGGNKSRAAQLLGLTARQFTYRCQKLGIS